MNKDELIKAVSEHAQLTKDNAGKAVDAILETITNTLKNGDSVNLIGFGSFKVSHRSAREGRNPQTGEPIAIPAMKVPSFSAGKTLKDAIKA
jgi:DNA-binding protein HU-beta